MPMLRTRRSVKQPPVYVVEDKLKKRRWTLVEKKKLLTGLRRYGARNVEAIQEKCLPDRTHSEIKLFLSNMKIREYRWPRVPKVKVPIELWTEMAEQLTSGVVDYSTLLADVMQKIGKVECHDEKLNRADPDWQLVYQYFTSLLKSEELPLLGQIEAGVVLDLLESLAHHLTTLDVANQRQLTMTKYNLLSTKVDPEDKKLISELALQAFNNDLPQPGGSRTTELPGTSSTTSHTDSGQPEGGGMEARNDGETSQTYSVKPMLAPLFSINPFCIPIKYLGLRQQSSQQN